MDEIGTRLQTTSQECLKAYETWEKSKKDLKAQEDLGSAIHELRKVTSRLEIELAVSEREQMASRPLPIPSHKSTSKGDKTSVLDNGMDDNNQQQPHVQRTTKRRRSPRKQD